MQHERRVSCRFFSHRCLRGMRGVSPRLVARGIPSWPAAGKSCSNGCVVRKVRGFITRSPGLFVCLPPSAASPKMRPNPSLERTHKGRPRYTARSLSVPRGLPLRAAQLKR